MDSAAIRCPKPDARLMAQLRRRVGPPKASPEGVTRRQLIAKIDELRQDADRKGRAGLEIAGELERCRTGAPKPTKTS